MAFRRLRSCTCDIRSSFSTPEPEETVRLDTTCMEGVRRTVSELKLLVDCMNGYVTSTQHYLEVGLESLQ